MDMASLKKYNSKNNFFQLTPVSYQFGIIAKYGSGLYTICSPEPISRDFLLNNELDVAKNCCLVLTITLFSLKGKEKRTRQGERQKGLRGPSR